MELEARMKLEATMRKVLKVVALIAAFAVLATASTYVTYRVMITRMTVEVPDLTGMTVDEADRALESRGLYLEVSGEDHDLHIPAGHVLSQDITAGEKVRGMAEIRVVVSKGAAVKLIPGVVGEELAEALKLFSQKGLEVRVVKVHSNTVKEDTIIAQWPAPEDWEGQNITVIASEGRYEVSYYCPSFLGLIKEDALTLARELGLNVELTETNDSEVMVASQKPLPGEKIESGGTLYLELKGVEYD